MLTQAVELPTVRLLPPPHYDRVLICLLGGFRLFRDGQPVDASIAGKATTLLSTLALHLETGVPRDALLDLLWPDQESEQSAGSLHSLIYSVHRRLRTGHEERPAVIHCNGSYALNQAAGVGTDIAQFDAIVLDGNRLAAFARDEEAAARYERAVALYRGDLAVGSDVYAVIERERLRSNFLTILSWLSDRAYRKGDYAGALDYAARMLAYDPCREDAHRSVMRVHVRRGERSQALRQFRLCEQILRREFDAAPEAATLELFDRVRGNAFGD